MDSEEITALTKLKLDWEVNDTDSKVVKGFIQLIQVSPLKVICFNESGVRLWHKMTIHSAASWDATGGFIKCKSTKKRILYYEIIVSSRKGASTPVAFMITESHSQIAVEELLTALRSKEKEIFEFNRVPIQMNSDRAAVLLQAGMRIFNGDTMEMYLQRCWRIVKGDAKKNDLPFCTIRACKAHVMKQASNICKKQYSNGNKDDRHRFAMYIFSCLVNATTLAQATNIVYHACIVLCSRNNSCNVEASIASIKCEMLKLPKDEKDVDTQPNPYDKSVADTIFDCDSADLIESTSPFKHHFDIVRTEANQVIETMNATGENKYFAEDILNQLYAKLISTIPIWSDLLSGDLRRFSDKYAVQINNCAKSTAISEATFKNTKVLLFQNAKHRIDECIQSIHKLYYESIMDFCEKKIYLPTTQHVHVPPEEESWNKKQKVPKHLRRSFQYRPSRQSKMYSQNTSSSSACVLDKTLYYF